MFNQLLSWMRAKKERHTVHGVIESVDSKARTITVTSGAETREVLSLDSGAMVMKGAQELQLKDIYLGEKLSALASNQIDGSPLATSVTIVEE